MSETWKTKIVKVELMIVNFDDLSEEEIKSVLENARYPNHCIGPNVMATEVKEVDWNDDHPLNNRNKMADAYNELFNQPNQ